MSVMATTTLHPPAAANFDLDDLHRITVEMWHDIVARERFEDREPYELLEGLIVKKMPEDAVHAAVISILLRLVGRHLPDGYAVRQPAPVTTEDSEPEPDLCIATGKEADYIEHHPTPADILLLIEVANTSLARDRSWKRRIYARGGTPAYWIVNLRDRTIETFADPQTFDDGDATYATSRIFAADEPVEFPIEGLPPLRLADVLPA
jgi:Uma2 family endonuclease